MVAIKGQPGRGHSVFDFGRCLMAFTESVYNYNGALTQELIQQVVKGMVLRVEIQHDTKRDLGLTSRFFEELGESSTVRLSHVNLFYNKDITDNDLGHLAKGCPALQRIYLSGCEQVTDTGLEHLAKGCPSLQQVELHACEQVTDTGRAALKNGHPNIIIRG